MGYRVLIIDDEPLIIQNLSTVINWRNFNYEMVEKAFDGKEALEIITHVKPHLILTDINMPEKNGIELLKALNQQPFEPIVILISGYDEFEYAREGLKYNAFDYILKPIDYEQLTDCIQRATNVIKQNEKKQYNELKQVLYDSIIVGNKQVEDTLCNDQYSLFMIRLSEKNDEQKLWNWIDKNSGLFNGHTFFLYKYLENDFVFIVKGENKQSSELKQVVNQMLEKVQSITNNQSFISIGGISSLSDLKSLLESAKDLLKLYKLTNKKIISKEDLNNDYQVANQSDLFINKAEKFIQENFNRDIGIEQVADNIGLSVSYFSLLFKQNTGMTFLEYLTKIRMDHACYLLKNTNYKTYDIANKVGYTDQRYFSQVFKRKMKMTPSEYRKKYQTIKRLSQN